MLSNTPIALMKITSEVEPALMNGNGSPVGGIEPVITSYCTKTEYNSFSPKICLKLVFLSSNS